MFSFEFILTFPNLTVSKINICIGKFVSYTVCPLSALMFGPFFAGIYIN